MRGRKFTWGARIAAAAGLGGLLFTVGCGTSASGLAAAAAASQPATPVVVGCEPNQRTLVRPSVVNGVAVSQIECVSVGEIAASAPAPIAQQPGFVPVSYQPASTVVTRNAELGDTRIVPASYPTSVARPVRARQVVYDEPPVREVKPQRSVKKSAIIIGSSAGVGAGIGAAAGGKKGALIGAVIGGGGATLWDQVTRRR
ncbi:MAG: hypothetical protein ACJ731_14975 [Vicinamibacterales bacterium]